MNDESNLVKTTEGWKYFCQDSGTCQALNRLLGYPYSKDVDFVTEGSEGIFKFEDSKLKAVSSLLRNYGQNN